MFDDQHGELEGFYKDLIDMLSADLDFQYKIRVSKSYGGQDENGNWTGVMRNLVNKVGNIWEGGP